jgi:hypothetical protein
LKETFNTEGLDYLDAIDELRNEYTQLKESNPDVLKQKINTIITTFVESEAPRELNISAKDRQSMLKTYSNLEMVGIESVMNQFGRVGRIIEGEMTNDVMPRFVRSSVWLNLVNTKGENWLDNVGVLKKAVEMEYTDDDFKGNYVEDRDIAFMRSISKDSYDWKLLGWDKNQQIMAFKSDIITKYFPKTAWVQDGASICKYVGILPYPFDVVEHYMLHAKYVNEFDANVVNQRTVQYLSYEELKERYPDKDMKQGRSVCVMLYDVKFPFPFAPRIYCVNSTAFHDPETQESITMSKPCYHESLSEYNLKKTLPFTDYQMYSIKKLDDQRTMYYQLHIAHFGSNMSNKMSKLVIYNRGKQLNSNIGKFMRERKEKTVPEDDPEDGLMRPLLDHKKYLQQQV